MKRRTGQEDVLDMSAQGFHVKGHGKNFKPLIAAGSWEISGFHYGRSQCVCCGRPIHHVLRLKNGSHADAVKLRGLTYSFLETIDIGIVCGPKVFIESCIGFYDDPAREWERQLKSWKDFISYILLCVKNADLWERIPVELRRPIDTFLEKGYEAQEHSGGFWQVKDAKKRYLRSRKHVGQLPDPRVLFAASRGLVYTAKRNGLLPVTAELKCDFRDGVFSVVDASRQVA